MTLFYAIVSAFLFALTFLFRKKASQFITLPIALFIELSIAMLIMFAYSLNAYFVNRKGVQFDSYGILFGVIAGISLAGGVIFNFAALKSGLLSKIVSVTSPSQIIFGVLLGYLFLKEQLTSMQILGVLVSIIGIILVTK